MNTWFSLDAQVESTLPGGTAQGLRSAWETPGALHVPGQRTVELAAGHGGAAVQEVQRSPLPVMGTVVNAAWQGRHLWLDGLWGDIEPGRSRLTLEGPGVSLAAWFLAFTEVHRAGGWVPLHAAVVAHGAGAVAILGSSGAGKSTAALRLLARGATVICEDRAFWHAPSGLVTGLDHDLRAFDDSVTRFAPELRCQARPERDAKGKLRFPVLQPGRAAPLVALLALGNGAPLAGAERVRLLWEATGTPLTEAARVQVQRGVNALVPMLRATSVEREEVLEVTLAYLGRRRAP